MYGVSGRFLANALSMNANVHEILNAVLLCALENINNTALSLTLSLLSNILPLTIMEIIY